MKMATPIIIPAIHKDLHLRLGGSSSGLSSRRGSAQGKHHDEETDEYEIDKAEEEAMVQMKAEDEEYLEELERRGLSLPNSPKKSAEIKRTSTPDRISELDIRPASPKKGITRTVTISEPIQVPSSIEKDYFEGPTLPSYQSQPRRRLTMTRSLSLARTNTMQSFSTFTTSVSEAWEKRHDRNHQGFWYNTWHWLIGDKNVSGNVDESDPEYVPPKYRWTPILSGLLQPFSILLEIPGLTEHWYVRMVDNVPVVYQNNPPILDVGLAISMACGVIANVALISRFLERRVLTSTIVTIVALSLHDIINIVAVTVFGVIHNVDDGFTYSEAFWLCVCSTCASMFTNITLCYDLYKTENFQQSGSGLTPKQRSLVIICMILLVYIAIGALCLNFLLPDIPFQTVMYFTIVSIETIGFGDVTPTTLGSKIFIFFYIPIGILNLAVAVGTARDTLVESWNAAYRRRRHEVLLRHRLRKQQRQEESIKRAAIERKLEEIGARMYLNRGGGVRGGSKAKKLNIKALSMAQLQEAEDEAARELASRQVSAPSEPVVPTGPETSIEDVTETQFQQEILNAQSLLSEENYREFQRKIAKEEKMENLIKFGFAFSLFIAFWLVGATVFTYTEHWSWFIGFYFCFIAFTTIGYGDVTPTSPAGRAFFIIWAIFGVATVTLLIAVLTEAYANRYKSALVQKKTKKAIAAVKEFRESGEAADREARLRDRQRMDRLPYEIMETLKEWHQHVSAARQTIVEGHESAGMRTIVQRLMDEQGLSERQKAELLADADSRRALFWNGYERATHDLLALAETEIKRHEANMRENQVLRELTISSSYAPSSSEVGSSGGRRKLIGPAGMMRARTATMASLGSVKEAWTSQPDLGESWDLEGGTLKGERFRRSSQ